MVRDLNPLKNGHKFDFQLMHMKKIQFEKKKSTCVSTKFSNKKRL